MKIHNKNNLSSNLQPFIGDRYIAPRSNDQKKEPGRRTLVAHQLLNPTMFKPRAPSCPGMPTTSDYYAEFVSDSLFGMSTSQLLQKKILSITHPRSQSRPIARPSLSKNILKQSLLFSGSIPNMRPSLELYSKCDRSLDAPMLMNDYYSYPITCSKTAHLAACVSNSVHMVNLVTKEVTEIANLKKINNGHGPAPHSVAWLPDNESLIMSERGHGISIANIGRSNTFTIIPNLEKIGQVRVLTPCDDQIVYLGSKNGYIIVCDLRSRSPIVNTYDHSKIGPVSALAFSANMHKMAVGFQRRCIHIIDIRFGRDNPICTLPHQSTVKTIAWAPESSNHLFTVDGDKDQYIRLFDLSRNQQINAVDTQLKTYNMHFLQQTKNLFISIHNNTIAIWKYNINSTRTPFTHLKNIEMIQFEKGIFSILEGNSDTLIIASPIVERIEIRKSRKEQPSQNHRGSLSSLFEKCHIR